MFITFTPTGGKYSGLHRPISQICLSLPSSITDLDYLFPLSLPEVAATHSRSLLSYLTVTPNIHLFPDITGPGEINSSVMSIREQFTLGNQLGNKNQIVIEKRHHTGLAQSCPRSLQYRNGHTIAKARCSTLIAPVEIWISWSLLMVPSRSTK